MTATPRVVGHVYTKPGEPGPRHHGAALMTIPSTDSTQATADRFAASLATIPVRFTEIAVAPKPRWIRATATIAAADALAAWIEDNAPAEQGGRDDEYYLSPGHQTASRLSRALRARSIDLYAGDMTVAGVEMIGVAVTAAEAAKLATLIEEHRP